MVTPIIQVRHLHNQFGSQIIHRDLNLDVYQGEILSLVGGSGSGKSVLLRSIMGLNQPKQGEIALFGSNMKRISAQEKNQIQRKLGVLFQQGALYSSMTVIENIAMPLVEHFQFSYQSAYKLALMKLSLVGLSITAAEKYPSDLSGGMIKRVALARALVLDPEILLLDEPTAGLDPISAYEFDQLILTLQKALTLTVMMVTHDLDTIFTISDRVAVLAEQHVFVVDTLERVKQNKNEWIQSYFNGPRGRAVHQTHQPTFSSHIIRNS